MFLLLLCFVCFKATSSNMSDLLVDNIERNISKYTCSINKVNSSDGEVKYIEMAICVEGKDLNAIEIINMWVKNFTATTKTTNEEEEFITRAKELIKDSTYVMSLRCEGLKSSDKKEYYMTGFCHGCKDIDSVSVLEDNSSFVFNKLSEFSKL